MQSLLQKSRPLRACVQSLICATLAMTQTPAVFAQDCDVTPLASFDSAMRAIDVHGTLAYASAGEDLLVLDVSNPTQPRLISSLDLPNRGDVVRDIAVGTVALAADDTRLCAVLANGLAGWSLVDLTNPSQPVLLTERDTGGECVDVLVVSNQIALADGLGGIKFVQDPAYQSLWRHHGGLSPWEIRGGKDVRSLAQTPDYLIYATTIGLDRVTLSNPNLPQSFRNLPSAQQVAASGYLVYAWSDTTLTILDASTAVPRLRGSLPLQGSREGRLTIDGNFLYASTPEQLTILDVTNPWLPQILLRRSDLGRSVISGRTGYFVQNGSLRIMDVTAPNYLRELGSFSLASVLPPRRDSAPQVVIEQQGDTIFATAEQGLRIVSVARPQHPELLSTLVLPSTPTSLAVAGSLLALTAADAVYVVDIRDPKHPALLSTVPQLANATDVRLHGTTAFVVHPQAGLCALSLAVPSAPVILDAYVGESSSHVVSVLWPFVYFGNTALRFDQGAFQYVYTFPIVAADVRVSVAPKRLYVYSHLESTMLLFDNSDPNNPVEIDQGYNPVPAQIEEIQEVSADVRIVRSRQSSGPVTTGNILVIDRSNATAASIVLSPDGPSRNSILRVGQTLYVRTNRSSYISFNLPDVLNFTWPRVFTTTTVNDQPLYFFDRVPTGGTVVMSAQADVPAALLHTWYRGSFDTLLTDGEQPTGSFISGANTPTLTIHNFQPADGGAFTLRSTLGCRSAMLYSNYIAGASCDSIDFNQDGVFPDDQDLLDFLALFASRNCIDDPFCHILDFDNNSRVDDQDLITFLRVMGGGICG